MKHEFSESSQKIMTLAQNEARQMNHDYVGTEHILLALLIERPGALSVLGVSAEAIRQEIDKLVTRGTISPGVTRIPLTPRSQHVIDSARLQAFVVGQPRIEPEHLLIGLMQEPDGVAHRVMRNLGLDLRQVEEASLKVRLAQMRIVERVVRPVRTAMARKRKMREELLAHLSEIYEEEYLRWGDSDAALHEAAKRFGDPTQLSGELQDSLTSLEDRRNYFFERWFGRRPPETAVWMMLRVSFVSFLCSIVIAVFIPMFIEMIAVRGLHHLDAVAVRALISMAIFCPMGGFLVGVCYFKIRDSLFGVFGSRKSLRNGILLATLASLCVLLCIASAIALLNASFQVVHEVVVPMIAVSVFGGIICLILARSRGPQEIRDTVWACMDLKTAE
jgi:ATP-dependent Clp protease ATP-binding subunit ClpC